MDVLALKEPLLLLRDASSRPVLAVHLCWMRFITLCVPFLKGMKQKQEEEPWRGLLKRLKGAGLSGGRQYNTNLG